MNPFLKSVTLRDASGNTWTESIVDRNAAHTAARAAAVERSNLRADYMATMGQFVVLSPKEQGDTGYYGRVCGYTGSLGHTEGDWTWLVFSEWKEVIASLRSEVKAQDNVLARREAEARRVATGRR